MVRYTVVDSTFFTDFGATGVLLNARTGNYYGLDQVSTILWRTLATGSPSQEELAAEVLKHFADAPPDQITSDINGFLQALEAKGLIICVSGI